MAVNSISIFRSPRTLLAVATLAAASLVPLTAQATPVTYELVTGSLDSVQLVDFTGASTPCPAGSAINCLVGAVAIDSGSITVDTATGQILDLNISLSGTGVLNLVGLNGWETGLFSGTTFQSTGPGLFGDLGGNQFHFLHLAGDLTIDALDLFAVGNAGPTPDYSGGYSVPAGPSGDITLTGDSLALTLHSMEIGYFPDPVTGQMVLALADFSIAASATPTNPIPELDAATLFCVGILIAGFMVRRTGAALQRHRPNAAVVAGSAAQP